MKYKLAEKTNKNLKFDLNNKPIVKKKIIKDIVFTIKNQV